MHQVEVVDKSARRPWSRPIRQRRAMEAATRRGHVGQYRPRRSPQRNDRQALDGSEVDYLGVGDLAGAREDQHHTHLTCERPRDVTRTDEGARPGDRSVDEVDHGRHVEVVAGYFVRAGRLQRRSPPFARDRYSAGNPGPAWKSAMRTSGRGKETGGRSRSR